MSSHWITIPEAALIANRSARTIYAWIEKSLLSTDIREDGTTVVNGRDVLHVESTVKRGRRPGTARPRTHYPKETR